MRGVPCRETCSASSQSTLRRSLLICTSEPLHTNYKHTGRGAVRRATPTDDTAGDADNLPSPSSRALNSNNPGAPTTAAELMALLSNAPGFSNLAALLNGNSQIREAAIAAAAAAAAAATEQGLGYGSREAAAQSLAPGMHRIASPPLGGQVGGLAGWGSGFK